MWSRRVDVCSLCRESAEQQALHREEDRILNEIASASVDVLAAPFDAEFRARLRRLLEEFRLLEDNKQNVESVIGKLVELEHDLEGMQ